MKTIHHLASLTTATIINVASLSGVAMAQTIINPDLNGSGSIFAGDLSGWSATGGPGWSPGDYNPTPDFDGGTAGLTIPLSPNGGTFVSGFGRTNGLGRFYEGIESNAGLSGLTPGQAYNLSFSQINIGTTSEQGDGYWQVLIAGTSYNSALMAFQGVGSQTWSQEIIEFTASSSTASLLFVARDSDYPTGNIPMGGYYGIDGISISPVPEPSSSALLLGLASLGFAARRKRTF